MTVTKLYNDVRAEVIRLLESGVRIDDIDVGVIWNELLLNEVLESEFITARSTNNKMEIIRRK